MPLIWGNSLVFCLWLRLFLAPRRPLIDHVIHVCHICLQWTFIFIFVQIVAALDLLLIRLWTPKFVLLYFHRFVFWGPWPEKWLSWYLCLFSYITLLVKEIKQYQKKWLQHVQRMDRNRLPRQTLKYRPEGRRNIGRPKKRWRDQLHFED